MPKSSSSSDRVLRARLAALTKWAHADGKAGTERARAASPSNISYFEHVVDPDGVLDADERLRRAERAKSAHLLRLSLKSAKARRRRAR